MWPGQMRAQPTIIPFGYSGLTVELGQEVLLSVMATGVTPFTYQWLFNGSPITNAGLVGGATTVDLTIAGAGTTLVEVYEVP